MLDAFSYLLCSELCWHNRLIPNFKTYFFRPSHDCIARYVFMLCNNTTNINCLLATLQNYDSLNMCSYIVGGDKICFHRPQYNECYFSGYINDEGIVTYIYVYIIANFPFSMYI